MLFISAPGTYLPFFDCDARRTKRSDAGAITLPVTVGRLGRPCAGDPADQVELERSELDLPRVAMRSDVPDYGRAVQPGIGGSVSQLAASKAGTDGARMTLTGGTGVENCCTTTGAAVRHAQLLGQPRAVSPVTNSEGPADGE